MHACWNCPYIVLIFDLTFISPDHAALDLDLTCGEDILEVRLSSARVEASGLNASTAHLAVPQCTAHSEQNGSVYLEMLRRDGSCGTVLRVRV